MLLSKLIEFIFSGSIALAIPGPASYPANLNTSQVSEHSSRLYYTDTRARASISVSSPMTYSTGNIGMPQATTSASGWLSNTDWGVFNAKQDLMLAATSTQNGYLTSTNWSTFNSKLASLSYSASTPSRTLDNNFTPSASLATMVFYTISIACTVTLSGSQTGSVELRSDTSGTPTTVRAKTTNTCAATLSVGLSVTNTQETVISYLVPPGHNVRLVSSGTATISLTQQSEVSIAGL